MEINQGLRDSFVESLATMADLENPKIEDTLAPEVLQALAEHFKERKINRPYFSLCVFIHSRPAGSVELNPFDFLSK